MKKNNLLQYQNVVLKSLAHRIDDFYLAGGTALSLFYFQHRKSLDLDFFTHNFAQLRVKEIIGYLKKDLRTEVKLLRQNLNGPKVKVAIYNIYFTSRDTLKIDFVEDVLELIKAPNIVGGINILSLEDIYLRKVHAVAGSISTFDEIGREKFLGGRIEAKDFFDLYFLSHTFRPLSDFVGSYCNATIKEGLINWFNSFDRMDMMDGVLSLDTDKKIDFKKLEKHFKEEIDKIIERQLKKI